MSFQSRPDEDYVLTTNHAEKEVKAVVTDTVSKLSVMFKMIVTETHKDQVLQQVKQILKTSCPVKIQCPLRWIADTRRLPDFW